MMLGLIGKPLRINISQFVSRGPREPQDFATTVTLAYCIKRAIVDQGKLRVHRRLLADSGEELRDDGLCVVLPDGLTQHDHSVAVSDGEDGEVFPRLAVVCLDHATVYPITSK